MRKKDELNNPASCMAKAFDDEMTFVLLGRDAAAPVAIRAWIDERIRIGKNEAGDSLLSEAEQCAAVMDSERSAMREAARKALSAELAKHVGQLMSLLKDPQPGLSTWAQMIAEYWNKGSRSL